MNYDYVFFCKGRQLEIVTDTILEAIEYLQWREPELTFGHLAYYVNLETGIKTPVFDKRKIFLDELKNLIKV